MYLLGYDIGSSSVKASLVDAQTGTCLASAFYPKTEAAIIAVRPGWAEQEPSSWWESLKAATADVMKASAADPADIVHPMYSNGGMTPSVPIRDDLTSSSLPLY